MTLRIGNVIPIKQVENSVFVKRFSGDMSKSTCCVKFIIFRKYALLFTDDAVCIFTNICLKFKGKIEARIPVIQSEFRALFYEGF